MQIYKNIPKTIPTTLKQNFVNFLINFINELFAGGKNTKADNIFEIDIFFIIVDIKYLADFFNPQGL